MFSSEGDWGGMCFRRHPGCFWDSFPLGRGAEGPAPCWLVAGGCLSVQRPPTVLCRVTLSQAFSQHGTCFFRWTFHAGPRAHPARLAEAHGSADLQGWWPAASLAVGSVSGASHTGACHRSAPRTFPRVSGRPWASEAPPVLTCKLGTGTQLTSVECFLCVRT